MKKKNLVLVFLSSMVVASCMTKDGSKLLHKDKPEERGSNQEEPWHFHTGKGIRFEEFDDERTGKKTKTFSSCDLYSKEAESLGCMERVYFFSKNDIDQRISFTTDFLEEKRQKHGANATLGAAIAATSFAAAGGLVITPEPLASKAGAITSVVFGLGSASYAAFESYQLSKVVSELNLISLLLEDENRFVQRCGHVRKDFIETMNMHGIRFQFPENGGQFIPAKDFQESFAAERALYENARNKAITERISTAEAYKKYFRNECGQLPIIDISTEDRRFADPNNPIPMDVANQVASLEESLSLISKQPVSLANFTKGDLYSDEQKNSLISFLINFRSQIDNFKRTNKEQFQLLQSNVFQFVISPSYKGFGIFYEQTPEFEVQMIDGKKYVFINAIRKSSFYSKYEFKLPTFNTILNNH